MKLQEIKNQIKFEQIDIGKGQVMMTALLTVSGTTCFDIEEIKKHPDSLKRIREHAEELLLRRIYEDQSQSMINAVYDFLSAAPFGPEFNNKKINLIRIACNQKPIN